MLTADAGTLRINRPNRACILEVDLTAGRVLTFRVADVWCSVGGAGGLVLELGTTGRRYHDPEHIHDLEIWRSETRRLAIFTTSKGMAAGGQQLVEHWGARAPRGLRRVLRL